MEGVGRKGTPEMPRVPEGTAAFSGASKVSELALRYIQSKQSFEPGSHTHTKDGKPFDLAVPMGQTSGHMPSKTVVVVND